MLVTNIIGMVTAKSRATRQRLVESALALFEAHGYSATTVDDIAAQAGVSAMTYFRYFPTKEAVVLEDHFDPIIAESVANQPATLPPLARVARGLREALMHLEESDDSEVRRRIAIAASEPALRSGMHQNTRETEDAIVAALTRHGTPEFTARIAAAACLGAITASLLTWASSTAAQSLRDAVIAALDIVTAAESSAPGSEPAATTGGMQ
ncbi:MAG: TetR family transcriptional regulator [Actinobacteria bacterium HGW-Actinobacteria-4]|nr:MAG: TetR family transcriptional regulator [Actinobacteria bacterium HGW-Actinobacteria-4]